MNITIFIWGFLLIIFTCIPSFYYSYMKKCSSKLWNVKKDETYCPLVTILIPAYNEEKVIRFKMENLLKLDYPRDKLQIIVIDDCSTDKTMQEVSKFVNSMDQVKIKVLDNLQRTGKTNSLNLALKNANGEVIVVSDADCFWASNILRKALPFLSDPSVGAVTGLEFLLNDTESWVTESEFLYNNIVHTIRVGESKYYSTIFFQGGFGAYRSSILGQFDIEADDSGTALNIIQKGTRALLIPEAFYYTMFPGEWRGKISTKLRRASQLLRLWFKCLKLFVQGKLLLPKRIFIPESFLYLVNPIIFVLLIVYSILVVFENPMFVPFFLASLIGGLIFKHLRTLLIEVAQEHLVLLGAILFSVLNKHFTLWSTAEVSRNRLSREILESHGLV